MVEFGSAELPQTYKQGFAGDVFNTGIYIKRCLEHQANVSFISAIGQDQLSDQFSKLMAQESLDDALLYRSNSEKMGLYLINVDDQGERSFTYWRDKSAAKNIMNFIQAEESLERFSAIDSLFFSGISIAILSEDDLFIFWKFIASLKTAGVNIIFDPNYRPTLWQSKDNARKAFNIAFTLSDVVLPGVEDHIALYGATSAEDVADYLEALGVEEIVIKNGPESILISEKGNRATIDIIPAQKVVDTTSAGDAFNGGYLSARVIGRSIEEAALFAANVAKCVIQHKGAIVNKADFAKHLNEFPM